MSVRARPSGYWSSSVGCFVLLMGGALLALLCVGAVAR